MKKLLIIVLFVIMAWGGISTQADASIGDKMSYGQWTSHVYASKVSDTVTDYAMLYYGSDAGLNQMEYMFRQTFEIMYFVRAYDANNQPIDKWLGFQQRGFFSMFAGVFNTAQLAKWFPGLLELPEYAIEKATHLYFNVWYWYTDDFMAEWNEDYSSKYGITFAEQKPLVTGFGLIFANDESPEFINGILYDLAERDYNNGRH